MSEQEYAGDVNPDEAWNLLKEDPKAVLIDVRTEAEWRYVGRPDPRSLDRELVCVQWQFYPDLSLNSEFEAELAQQGVSKEATVLLICRSGQRSKDAAIVLTKAGYRCCYNVAEGFEGPCNEARHRGAVSGWKVRGLPWRQG